MVSNPFYRRDVVSIKEFGREDLEFLFSVADRVEGMKREERMKLAEGRCLGLLFFEPSTRTRLSFEAAMLSIGGGCVGFSEPSTTSVAKGESLADTIRVVEGYVDLMVLRHPMEGAARFAAEVASKPVVNAGSGSEEHPTQAMLDLYTMVKEKGRIDGLKVAVVGDLKYGRTIYSLLYALAKFKTKIYLVSPPELRIRDEALITLEGQAEVQQHSRVEDVIGEVDVLYVTRIQRERFPDPHEYERVKGAYVIDRRVLEGCKDDLIIMHPLPRVDEIKPEVDETKHARYFKEAAYGKTLRAALLTLILNEKPP